MKANTNNMEDKSQAIEKDQSKANTLVRREGEKYSDFLKRLPYSEDRVGQAFIIQVPHSYNKPKNDTKR